MLSELFRNQKIRNVFIKYVEVCYFYYHKILMEQE